MFAVLNDVLHTFKLLSYVHVANKIPSIIYSGSCILRPPIHMIQPEQCHFKLKAEEY